MQNVIEYKESSFELKDINKSSRVMIGAYAAYNNEDSHLDIGRKGMFTKSWNENSVRIKHFLNHDVTKPVGKVVKFWEDEKNAFYESKIGTHAFGNDVLEMAESGLLTEHSYGYKVIKSNKLGNGGRELIEVKLMEISNMTGWGSNANTPLISYQKSMQEDASFLQKMVDRNKNLEKFCKDSTATDETIELLLLEAKHLTQIILELKKQDSTMPPLSTLPQQWTGKLIFN
jgi:uncharacterized protein